MIVSPDMIASAVTGAGFPSSYIPYGIAMADQESSRGAASQNVMQVIPSTAANPGYGVAPLSEQDRLDPAKNLAWSFKYDAARAKSAGLDPNNPDDIPAIIALHNGGGDPNYYSHVVSHMGPTAQGHPMSGSLPQQPPIAPTQVAQVQAPPQIQARMAPVPQGVQDSSGIYGAGNRYGNLTQELLSLAAGFAGKRTFGEALSSAAGNLSDTLAGEQQRALDVYRQQLQGQMFGLRADTANANNATKTSIAQAKNGQSAAIRDSAIAGSLAGKQIEAGVDERGQDLRSQYQQSRVNVQQQRNGIGLRRVMDNEALYGIPSSGVPQQPISILSQPPYQPPATAPQLPVQSPTQPPAAPPSPPSPPPQSPPSAPSQPSTPASSSPASLPPAPSSGPWALPALPTFGGIRGAQQMAQKNSGERDRYARDHAGDLINDQALINNLDQYQGAYNRLQNTPGAYPGMGASWRIPLQAMASGNFSGNPDAAELTKQHATLTQQLAGAKGRVLVAGLKLAGASLPDQSVPYKAGTAVLRSAKANAILQMREDQARMDLMQHNPNATPGQIESAVSQYAQGVGNPYTTGKDGSVTPANIPTYDVWSASRSIPPKAIQALKADPTLRNYFDQKYGKGAAANILGN